MKKVLLVLIILCIIGCKKKYDFGTSGRLQYELSMLKNIQWIVYDSLIPDRWKDQAYTASHDLMYADYNSDSYWSIRGRMNEANDSVKTCETYMFIYNLVNKKQQEVDSMQEIFLNR